jgi:hypothetical protein
MRRRAGMALALIAVLAVAGGLVRYLWPAGQPRAVHAKALTGVVIGVREPQSPKSFAEVGRFGKITGTQPRLAVYYSSWWEPFQVKFAQEAGVHHCTVLVQIEPQNVTIASIGAGKQDWYLRRYADEVRTFGHLVVISFAPEMNGAWTAWGQGHVPPSEWIQAWRHVVTVFRSQGADNVTWLWDVSTGVKPPESIAEWWPGGQYVDWIGLDGYYYRPGDTFRRKFLEYVGVMRRFTTKPVLLAEVGIGPVAGQAKMMPDLFSGVKKQDLIGLVWFDVHQHDPPVHQDWRLEGHPAAIAAFRRGVQSLQPPRRKPPGPGQTAQATRATPSP